MKLKMRTRKRTDKSIDEMMADLFEQWDYIEVGRFDGDNPWFCRNITDEGIGRFYGCISKSI